jgi:tryptophan halogenase
VCVLGGGTAGYFSALALRKWFPDLRITIVESSKIPIIGVGEATTPPLLPFLHNFLGLDIEALYRQVRPTWKLGIRFDWGNRGGFNYPFTWGKVAQAHAYDGYIERASLGSMLMTANRVPVFRREGELISALDKVRFAYHLDNRPFVEFLREGARAANIEHYDAIIADALTTTGPDGEPVVECLVTDGGERLEFDFYVDCSGFRSVLMDKALGSPYIDYTSSLVCDRAVVAGVPHDGTINGFTLAETMDHGWCWSVPMHEENHRGYVYSSEFVSEDEAIAEMQAKNPRMSTPRVIEFGSGRREHFWRGNTVAIGNSYGFVEPLESTALHMAIIQVTRLVRLLDSERVGTDDHDRDHLNRRIGAHWDFLRWFLAIHYRFNGKLDTPFWRHCRQHVDISGLEDVVDDFRENGPLSGRGWERPADAIFGSGGIDIMLLGQDVPTVAQPATDREAWERDCAQREAITSHALTFREAAGVLESRPEFLHALVSDPGSWTALFTDEMVR